VSFLGSLPRFAVGCSRGLRRRLDGFDGFDLAHGRAVEFEPVGVVDNAIQYRIAESGFANNLMPGCHGSWLVMRMEPRPWRSSTISIRGGRLHRPFNARGNNGQHHAILRR
jgi:hypothetical protein